MTDDGRWLALGAAAVFAAAGLASSARTESVLPHCLFCGRIQRGSRAGTPQDYLQPAMAAIRAKAYSVGVPVKRAKTTWPLMRHGAQLGVLDTIAPPELVLKPRHTPTLVLSEVVYTQNAEGKASKIRSTNLFSAPGKMDAPTLALPAGPPSLGGTCTYAAMTPGKGPLAQSTGTFVCSACYALHGRYPMHALPMAIRLRWITGLLEADPSGAELGRRLSAAVTHHATQGGGSGWDKGMEFGTWLSRGLGGKPGIMRPNGCFAPSATLPGPLGSSTEVIARLRPRDGQVAGYFRWLDSGDVNVGRSVPQWLGFIAALGAVAHDHPAVLFWLPTRSWGQPRVAQALAGAMRANPNLIVRPSGYTTCSPPPIVAGLAAGTAVADAGKGARIQDPEGRQARGCPAYLGGRSSTCLTVHCRTCWASPGTPVWYPLH